MSKCKNFIIANSSFSWWAAWLSKSKNKKIAGYGATAKATTVLNYFGIDGTHNLTLNINNTEAGSVQLNSLTLSDSSWQGEYFDNIPISIEAIANEGYVFSHWDGVTGESSAALTISMTADMTIQAVFIAQ